MIEKRSFLPRRAMATKRHEGTRTKVGAVALTGLSAACGATWLASAFVAPAVPLRLQLRSALVDDPLQQTSALPGSAGAVSPAGSCLAMGAVGVAAAVAAAALRKGRSSRAVRQAEPEPGPQPGREPEIDPRRQDPPNTVPPVRMPMVDTGKGEKLDVMSKLLEDRIIILGGEVKDEMAQILVAQMLYLANTDPDQDITMYINSPGGSVSAGMAALLQVFEDGYCVRAKLCLAPKAIYDTMQFIPCDAAWQQFVCCQLHSLRARTAKDAPFLEQPGEHRVLRHGCLHGLLPAVCWNQGQAPPGHVIGLATTIGTALYCKHRVCWAKERACQTLATCLLKNS